MSNVVIEMEPRGGARALVPTSPLLPVASMMRDRYFVPAAGFLSLCLLLGGSSAGGVVPNALLQLAAVALLLWLVHDRSVAPLLPAQRWLVGLALAAVGLVAVQLLPLPPGWWSGMAGRAFVVQGYDLLELNAPWLPLTLAPERTLTALLACLPGLAMLLLTLRVGRDGRLGLALVVIAGAACSALLGLLQMRVGPETGRLYPYTPTNLGLPVGVFANVNHQATLLLCALPMTGLLAGRIAGYVPRRSNVVGAAVLLAAALMVVLIALLLTRSMAAALLFLPALLGAAVAMLPAVTLRASHRRLILVAAAVAGVVALVAVVLMLSGQLLAVPLGDPANPSDRPQVLATTLVMVGHFAPWGAGFGSLPLLYPDFVPTAAVNGGFVNHTHNDYAELMSDGGIAAMALIAATLAWVGIAGTRAILATGSAAASRRAGLVVVAIVLLHSVVDYPARTAAILAVLALGLAYLSGPVRDVPAFHRP